LKHTVNWPVPRNLTEVRAFIGLCSYYRKFICGFSTIAAPLHQLTRKGERFEWNASRQAAFDRLKACLTTAPVLGTPRDTGTYYLDTDASNESVGAVLSQEQDGELRVLAYASRALTDAERNYCTTRKELLVIVYGLKQYRQYLLARQFVIRTDHAALQSLRKTPEPLGQQGRWLDLIEQFSYSIQHRSGRSHANADSLSRRPCERDAERCKQCERSSHRKFTEAETDNLGSKCGMTTSVFRCTGLPRLVPGETLEPTTLVAVDPVTRGQDASFSVEINDTSLECEPALPFESVANRGKQIDLLTGHQEPVIDCNSTSSETMVITANASASQHELIQERLATSAIDVDHGSSSAEKIEVDPWSKDSLARAQQEDNEIGLIYSLRQRFDERPPWKMVQAESEAVKAYWTQWSSLIFRDNVLYKKFLNSDGFTIYLQILLPQLLRAEFIRQSHNGMTGGHLGPSKTRDQVQRRAYWCGWRKDVELICRRCEPCCRYHRGPPPRQGHLQSLDVGMPMERLHIDLTGPHPRSRRGYQYILTCIDPFTKFAEAIAIRDKTAHTVAKALTEQVFCRYGVPLALMSDLGREFENETMYEICRLLQVDKLRSTAYKPSTNGVVERLHRTLNSMLGKVVKEHQKDWCEHLPFVMAAYRATRHNSTQFSPNFLTFGREVRAPIDIVLGRPEGEDSLRSSDDYADDLIERQRKAYILVRKQLGTAAERTKRYYDMKVKPVTFSVGDWVWVYNPRRYAGRSPKWNRAYEGPFLVEKVLGPVNFVVRKSRRAKPRIVHIDKLKACLNSTLTSWLGKPHSCEPVGEQLLNLPNDMDPADTEKSDHHHEVYSTPMTSAITGTKEPATEITGTKEPVITATGAIKPVITETCITGSSLGLDITPRLRPQRDRRPPLRFRTQSCSVSC
jgi:hypothetical protein